MSDGPPLPVRIMGRTIAATVARVPAAWRLLRGPQARFFDRLAAGWGAGAEGELRAAPLNAALDELTLDPRRALDVGTGTGRGARELARRYPEAEVLGVDISAEMVRHAEVPDELAGRLRFEHADLTSLQADSFDLVVQLNVPVFFADLARALAPGGTVVVASTAGPATPYFTPHARLRRGFARAGLAVVGEGTAGAGTWLAARLP